MKKIIKYCKNQENRKYPQEEHTKMVEHELKTK